jgi:hypothetical protein
MGGPAVPDRPLLNSKWDNRVTILRGSDLLFAYRMTPDSGVLNVASQCCHTFLLGRHDGYDANCVTTASDFVTFHHDKKPTSRWFANQWERERLERYEPLVGIWVDENGTVTGDEGWEKIFQEHVEVMQREIPKEAIGISFDEIVQGIVARGVPIVIVSRKNQRGNK